MYKRQPIQFGALLIALAAGFAAVSYELGRRTDRVQQSSRLAEAIRNRVPPEAVEKLGSNKAVQRLKPLASRMTKLKQNVAPAPAASAAIVVPEGNLDPTLVQLSAQEPGDADAVAPKVQTGRADDVDKSAAAPIDQVDWATPVGLQVSGDGVWLTPKDPPTTLGEDGQYRLWD